MVILRCTKPLLARLKTKPAIAPPPSTTRLGDWHAKWFQVGRQQFVLAMGERTFLPVLVPAAPVATVAARIRAGLAALLLELKISPTAIARETAEMESVSYAATSNRQVLGLLVDFAKSVPFYLDNRRDVARELARTPCSPLWNSGPIISPDEATVALFARPDLRLVR